MNGLVVKNIRKNYKSRPVVRNVSLTVKKGEVVGLLGPNGAGKTTSFYMISGLVKPDYGTITLDGKDVTFMPMYRRARCGIGYLPQEMSIFRGMSVEDNISSILEVTEKEADKREAYLEELLADFSITHLRSSSAISLSGGERRRVEIARCLASEPNYILLDEPLAGIDPLAVADIRDLIGKLKERGLGVLITDHNVTETLKLIDRGYIIHNGTVIKEGSATEITKDEEVNRVYLGNRFNF